MTLHAASRCALLIAAVALLANVACQPTEVRGQVASATVTTKPAGFEITGPYQHENLAIWLLHGDDRLAGGDKLLALEDALAQGIAVVHETGQVNQLAIENKSQDLTVWVQAGDVVQGGQQDRTLGVDLALAPNSGVVPIASFCVEQGRWSARGRGQAGAQQIAFLSDGQDAMVQDSEVFQTDQAIDVEVSQASVVAAPPSTAGSTSASSFDLSENSVSTLQLKKAVLLQVDQSAVWQEVAVGQSMLASSTNAMVVDRQYATSWEMTMNSEAAREARAPYETALASVVEARDDVIGCVIAINGKLDSADVYASRDLFRQLWPKLLRGAAIAAVAVRDQPRAESQPDEAAITAFLADAEGDELHSRQISGYGTMTTGENPVGHVVESRFANHDGYMHRTYLAK